MTTPTYAQYKQLSSALAGLSAETIEERLLTLFSVLASGQNPDGTAAPGQGASSAQLASNNVFTGQTQTIKARQPSLELIADNGGWTGLGIDSQATVPYRDIAIARSNDLTGGSVSDEFYGSYNAATGTISNGGNPLAIGATSIPLTSGTIANNGNGKVLIGTISGGDAEIVTVTGGWGTTTLTCNATTKAHADGALVTLMGDTANRVTWGVGFTPAPSDMRFNIAIPGTGSTQGGLRIATGTGTPGGDPFLIESTVGATAQARIASDYTLMLQAGPANLAETNGSTNSTTTVTLSTVTVTKKLLGSFITGSGIPTGSYITGVNTGANTVTINAAATATASGLAFTIYVPNFRVQNAAQFPLLQVGPGSGAGVVVSQANLVGFGSGMGALPTAQVDIAVAGSGNATFKIRTATWGAYQVSASGTTPGDVTAGTTNATALKLQTNGTTRITLGSGGNLGFFGAAAVAQPSAAGSATGYAAGATAVTFHSDDTYTGNVGSTAYTLNGIVAALKNLGLIAS